MVFVPMNIAFASENIGSETKIKVFKPQNILRMTKKIAPAAKNIASAMKKIVSVPNKIFFLSENIVETSQKRERLGSLIAINHRTQVRQSKAGFWGELQPARVM